MLCCWTSWLSLGFACDIQVLSEQQLLGVGIRSMTGSKRIMHYQGRNRVCECVVVGDGAGGWSFYPFGPTSHLLCSDPKKLVKLKMAPALFQKHILGQNQLFKTYTNALSVCFSLTTKLKITT